MKCVYDISNWNETSSLIRTFLPELTLQNKLPSDLTNGDGLLAGSIIADAINLTRRWADYVRKGQDDR